MSSEIKMSLIVVKLQYTGEGRGRVKNLKIGFLSLAGDKRQNHNTFKTLV